LCHEENLIKVFFFSTGFLLQLGDRILGVMLIIRELQMEIMFCHIFVLFEGANFFDFYNWIRDETRTTLISVKI